MLPEDDPPKRPFRFCASCGFGRPADTFGEGITRCSCGCTVWRFEHGPSAAARLRQLIAMAETDSHELCNAATIFASADDVKGLCAVVLQMRAWIVQLSKIQ